MKYFLKWFVVLMMFLSVNVFAENVSNGNVAAPQNGVSTPDKPVILVKASHPEFTIRLKSNATTGYSWFLRSYDNQLIVPVSHHYERPVSQLVGAPGFEVWKFRVKEEGFVVPQVTYVRLVYSRPWEAESPTTSQVEFKVTTVVK